MGINWNIFKPALKSLEQTFRKDVYEQYISWYAGDPADYSSEDEYNQKLKEADDSWQTMSNTGEGLKPAFKAAIGWDESTQTYSTPLPTYTRSIISSSAVLLILGVALLITVLVGGGK